MKEDFVKMKQENAELNRQLDMYKTENQELESQLQNLATQEDDKKKLFEDQIKTYKNQLDSLEDKLTQTKHNEERYYNRYLEEHQYRLNQQEECRNLNDALTRSDHERLKLKKMLDRKVTRLTEIDLMMDAVRQSTLS